MQVMPATGRELAERMGLPYSRERLNDPTFSVQIGSRYFRQVLDMFDGNVELALAGYNAGPYRIRKLVRAAGSTLEMDSFLEGLRIEESKTYVKRVVLFSELLRAALPGARQGPRLKPGEASPGPSVGPPERCYTCAPFGPEVGASVGSIAQRLEHPAHNRAVPGSNPGGPTTAKSSTEEASVLNRLASLRRVDAALFRS